MVSSNYYTVSIVRKMNNNRYMLYLQNEKQFADKSEAISFAKNVRDKLTLYNVIQYTNWMIPTEEYTDNLEELPTNVFYCRHKDENCKYYVMVQKRIYFM